MARVSRDVLRPGDHISTNCGVGLYRHHGIYVGKAKVTNPNNKEEQQEIDDAVIHFLGRDKKRGCKQQCRRCFYMPQYEGVVISCLDCFLDGEQLYRSTCYILPPDKVIQTAFSFLEKTLNFGPYELFTNNCEHFAFYCKSGRRESEQVRSRLKASAGVIGAALVVSACTVS